MGRKLNVAIVGLEFGKEFIPIYQRHPHTHLYAICQRNREKLDRTGDEFGVDVRYDDYARLLQDPEIDVVHINTPLHLHSDQAVAALEAGKHVGCTIPMATSVEGCRRIVEAAEKTGLVYMMMETVVYAREFLHVKDLFEQGELGRVQFIRASHQQEMWGWPDYWHGMPPMYNATHAISPCLALGGWEAEYVSCFGSGRVQEFMIPKYRCPFAIESTHIKFKDSDVVAEVTRSLFNTARQYREHFDVYGSKRSFEWSLIEHEDHILHTGEEPSRIKIPDFAHRLPEEIRPFTTGGVYGHAGEGASGHRSFTQGGGHGGSHPHLVHELISAIREGRDPYPNARQAANITCSGILSHESAMHGGKSIPLPEWTFSKGKPALSRPLPGTAKSGAMHALRTLAALVALAGAASAQSGPLVKDGPCPELARESASWMGTQAARTAFARDTGLTIAKYPGTIQTPLEPGKSLNCLETPAGFRAELWASETSPAPVQALQAFTFDERGRMWAVETFDYPNQVTAPFAGSDRVVILEDTDGDMVADKHTVFVSGLNIPKAIEIVPQGLVVAMAPHIVLFEDKDGDDKADEPKGKILYTGFGREVSPGTEDTHGSVQGSMRYGLDNWLYVGNGYDKGTVTSEIVKSLPGVAVKSTVVRMRTDGKGIEALGSIQGNNSSGFGMMEDGQVFTSAATDGGNTHIQHYPIPGQRSKAISGYGNSILPITKDLIQASNQGEFTAATGPEIYTSRLFPRDYWNRAAFVSEPTGHLLNADFLAMDKSTWTAAREDARPNILASTDAWTAPIFSRVGPDGALWVLDWYSYVMLHNGPFTRGDGNAWEYPGRKDGKVRIYRVVPADGSSEPVLDLSQAGFSELVDAFGNPNMFWRSMAQKLILRKATTPAQKAQAGALLAQAARSRRTDAVGIDGVALHALWTAEGLGLFASDPETWDPILKELLLHPAASVRMNAVKAMPATPASIQAIKDQCVINDENPQVRLAVLLAMEKMPALAGIRMDSVHRYLDTWSQLAFEKAKAGSGVASSASPTCAPVLHPASVGPIRPTAAGRSLRFASARGGWQVVPDASLGRGELILYDARGGVVDRISFDGSRWSRPLRAGGMAVHHYVFRSRDGLGLRGRLTPGLAP